MPKKYTYQEVKDYVESKGCTLLSKAYIGNKVAMKVVCTECGDPYDVTFDHFKGTKKYKCNKCSGKFRYTVEDVQRIVKKESSCELLSCEYVNNFSEIKLKCECGNTFSTTFKSFSKGKKQCDDCTNNKMSGKMCKSHNDFVNDISNIFKDEFSVVGEYTNIAQKVSMRHNKCGHVWDANPSDMLHKKSGCPKCNESKGEKRIESFLSGNGIKYITQYKIKECKNQRALPFDFAIFDDDNNLISLCEYDGILHYENKFKCKKEYELGKMRDEIKNNYCKDNNIKLIRIPYYKFNEIEEILKSAL